MKQKLELIRKKVEAMLYYQKTDSHYQHDGPYPDMLLLLDYIDAQSKIIAVAKDAIKSLTMVSFPDKPCTGQELAAKALSKHCEIAKDSLTEIEKIEKGN